MRQGLACVHTVLTAHIHRSRTQQWLTQQAGMLLSSTMSGATRLLHYRLRGLPHPYAR